MTKNNGLFYEIRDEIDSKWLQFREFFDNEDLCEYKVVDENKQVFAPAIKNNNNSDRNDNVVADCDVDGNGNRDNKVKLNINPVLFEIHENFVDSDTKIEDICLIVVILDGWLIVKKIDKDQYRIIDFSTKLEIYRIKDDKIFNIFGAHYDHVEDSNLIGQEFGHPKFHVQINGKVKFIDIILEKYQDCEFINSYLELFSKEIRIPTAQMDFFTVLLQIFTDIILTNNNKNELISIINLCNNLKGINHKIGNRQYSHDNCLNSTNWYGIGQFKNCSSCRDFGIVCKCTQCGEIRCNSDNCPGNSGRKKGIEHEDNCLICQTGVYKRI